MWVDEARIWTHSPIARSNEERMRVYTTSTCILLLIRIKEQQPFRSLSIFQHVTPTHIHKSFINLLFLAVLQMSIISYTQTASSTTKSTHRLYGSPHWTHEKRTTGTATTVPILVSQQPSRGKGPANGKGFPRKGAPQDGH